jgi:ribosome modulation factor
MDRKRMERATGRPAFDCPFIEPDDMTQWCTHCRENRADKITRLMEVETAVCKLVADVRCYVPKALADEREKLRSELFLD